MKHKKIEPEDLHFEIGEFGSMKSLVTKMTGRMLDVIMSELDDGSFFISVNVATSGSSGRTIWAHQDEQLIELWERFVEDKIKKCDHRFQKWIQGSLLQADLYCLLCGEVFSHCPISPTDEVIDILGGVRGGGDRGVVAPPKM